MKKGGGIPNIFPYKEELMNSIERKENMDKETKEHMKALAQANNHLPKGNLEHYAQTITAKVERFEEEKTTSGITDAELKEANYILDPNSKGT